MRSRNLRSVFSVLLALGILLASFSAAGAKPPTTIDVQVLAVNDFHGALRRFSSSGAVIGGVEYLATLVKQQEATNPNTVFVSAGDLIGASPLTSAIFHDEPTIEAFNLMGLDYAVTGNHEFDEGVAELKRIQEGGCHPIDGCLDGDPFLGAEFKFLASNVVQLKNGQTLFSEYKIRTFEGVKVAFIGIALEGTPTIVTPAGTAGVAFQDEADTINNIVSYLQDFGVEAFVAIIHQGGFVDRYTSENACVNFGGDITSIVPLVDDKVDVFITGHTHGAYNCVYDDRVVTGAGSSGTFLTDIDLTLDPATGDVVASAANNISVGTYVPADPALTALVDKYETLSAPIANRVIGSITADILASPIRLAESALGDVIADAHLYVTAPADQGGAVIAFTNPGGLRKDFIYSQISAGEQPGEVTYAEAFAVQPFYNDLVTLSLTGAQIDALLEQQWSTQRMLQPSMGFSYTWSASAALGSKVSDITVNGVAIDPNATYRVTVNSYLAGGGDGFSVFTYGTDRLVGMTDIDALVEYFAAASPIAPGPMNRAVQVP